MHLTQVHPDSGRSPDITTDAGRDWLREVYALPHDRYLRLNMITALTGSAVGSDGTSDTLTSRVDRVILGIVRAHADAALVGAATVRSDGYVVPRRTRLAVLTTSGDLSGHRLDDGDRVVLVCPADRVDEVRRRAGLRRAEVVGIEGGSRPDPAGVITALAAHGLSRIVCEGGPAVASQLAAAGLIDEYCITVAPALQPADGPFLRLSQSMPTEVAGMLVDDAAFSYLRLRPRRPDRAPAATG